MVMNKSEAKKNDKELMEIKELQQLEENARRFKFFKRIVFKTLELKQEIRVSTRSFSSNPVNTTHKEANTSIPVEKGQELTEMR